MLIYHEHSSSCQCQCGAATALGHGLGDANSEQRPSALGTKAIWSPVPLDSKQLVSSRTRMRRTVRARPVAENHAWPTAQVPHSPWCEFAPAVHRENHSA